MAPVPGGREGGHLTRSGAGLGNLLPPLLSKQADSGLVSTPWGGGSLSPLCNLGGRGCSCKCGGPREAGGGPGTGSGSVLRQTGRLLASPADPAAPGVPAEKGPLPAPQAGFAPPAPPRAPGAPGLPGPPSGPPESAGLGDPRLAPPGPARPSTRPRHKLSAAQRPPPLSGRHLAAGQAGKGRGRGNPHARAGGRRRRGVAWNWWACPGV